MYTNHAPKEKERRSEWCHIWQEFWSLTTTNNPLLPLLPTVQMLPIPPEDDYDSEEDGDYAPPNKPGKHLSQCRSASLGYLGLLIHPMSCRFGRFRGWRGPVGGAGEGGDERGLPGAKEVSFVAFGLIHSLYDTLDYRKREALWASFQASATPSNEDRGNVNLLAARLLE